MRPGVTTDAMSQRTDRVDELLRQEIGTLLAKEIADPRIGFATITDVETAPDLRHAKVWVQRDRPARATATRRCGRSSTAMPFIRHELGRRLRIKRIPELHVHLDDSAERGTRVLHLLRSSRQGVEPEAIAPINESLPTPVQRLPHEGDAEPEGSAPAPRPTMQPPPARIEPARRPPRRRGPGGPARRPRRAAQDAASAPRTRQRMTARRSTSRRSRATPSRHPCSRG